MDVLITNLLFGVQLVASYFATRIAGKEKGIESGIPFLELMFCTRNIEF